MLKNIFLQIAQYLAIIIYIIIALFCFSNFLDLYISLVFGLLILPSALYIQELKSSYLLIITNIFSYILFSIAIVLFEINHFFPYAIALIIITILLTVYAYFFNYRSKQNINNLNFTLFKNSYRSWILFCYFCFPTICIIRVTNPIYIILIAIVFLFIVFFEIIFIYDYIKKRSLKQFLKYTLPIIIATSIIIAILEFFTLFKIAWGLDFYSNLKNDIIGSVVMLCYMVITQIFLLYIYVRLAPKIDHTKGHPHVK